MTIILKKIVLILHFNRLEGNQSKYNKKNNTILMGFDTIDIYLVVFCLYIAGFIKKPFMSTMLNGILKNIFTFNTITTLS